jgi:hypothetical protein
MAARNEHLAVVKQRGGVSLPPVGEGTGVRKRVGGLHGHGHGHREEPRASELLEGVFS